MGGFGDSVTVDPRRSGSAVDVTVQGDPMLITAAEADDGS